ncbi:MAG: phospholipase [Hyphomicrobiaceae bacterium]|nr:phospholipase [Hyphomicrobiaceae bacterium]
MTVTLHVLLRRAEVRSSIAWIGLAWLSPFLGSAIYLAFGVNRVARRGSRIGLAAPGADKGLAAQKALEVLGAKTSEGILSLARTGDSISGLPLVKGNDLTLYRNGDEAYPAMLAAIASAKGSVALLSYIFRDDAVGQRFADALIAARRRGIEVRVLVDGIGSGYLRSPITERLRAGGVEVRRFLHEWLPWKMPFINLRNHKKILVVDGTIGFTGGMNISLENTMHEGQLAVQDVHAKVLGPVVGQLMMSFAEDWAFSSGERLNGEAWWPVLKRAGKVTMRGISSGPDESLGSAEMILAGAIEQATERIRIVTPYFLPEDRLFETLRRAALRGVAVEIVVPAESNHFYFGWAMMAHLSSFSLDGINCHLSAQPFDHSKLVSIDGAWAGLGSANWDARSMRLNFEFLLECYGDPAVAQIDRMIDEKIVRSTRLTRSMLAGRSGLVKLRDASARLLLPYL